MRQRISRTNLKILELLNRRGSLVLQAWEEKQDLGMELCDRARERQMLEELTASNRGPFTDDMLTAVFREIFKASRMLMQRKNRQG